MNMPIVRKIYDNQAYSAHEFTANNSRDVVVLFQSWQERPSLEQGSFGEYFLNKEGINYISIRCANNDWYQGPFDEVLQACRSAIDGRYALGYSSSMGAYAILNFYEDLGLFDAISFAPQYSIDQTKVPFEGRWRQEAANISFNNDKISRQTPIRRAVVITDPTGPDKIHSDLIASAHPIERAWLPFTDHNPAAFMLEAGFLGDFSRELIKSRLRRDVFDVNQNLRELARQYRHISSLYFVSMSKALFTKKRTAAAVAMAERAMIGTGGNHWPVHAHAANLNTLCGNPDRALAILDPWLRGATSEEALLWIERALRASGLPNLGTAIDRLIRIKQQLSDLG